MVAPVPPSIVPEFVYRDVRAAMSFLERAFGFAPGLVVPDSGDAAIEHAELWTGNACVMLASYPADDRWRYRTPADIGGVNTGSVYLASSDIAGLYARAVAAGAPIARELAGTDYGSRDFSVRDPEGFLWHFGTYWPGDADTVEPEAREPELFTGARYTDARAAMAWLANAFGAVEQFVVPGDGDDITHAQMLLEGGVIMLGSARDDGFNMRTPDEIGGVYTQSVNVSVGDPDAHHARAAAAGATILAPLADTPYGARGYVARDCAGYVWSFSTYRPVRPPLTADLRDAALR